MATHYSPTSPIKTQIHTEGGGSVEAHTIKITRDKSFAGACLI
jgi:hypothetical protein